MRHCNFLNSTRDIGPPVKGPLHLQQRLTPTDTSSSPGPPPPDQCKEQMSRCEQLCLQSAQVELLASRRPPPTTRELLSKDSPFFLRMAHSTLSRIMAEAEPGTHKKGKDNVVFISACRQRLYCLCSGSFSLGSVYTN